MEKACAELGAAADLTISEGGIAVKYNVYLRERAIVLQFESTDRGRAELAARLLKLAGVNGEVRKESDRDAWYVKAYTDMLAAGRGELREALIKIVETARSNGWVDADEAERWLEKLESGRVLREGWPKYYVGLTNNGALVVEYRSTNLDSIKQVEQQLKQMGLEKDVHFTVKIPKDDTPCYVYIRREGLAYAAWLSVRGYDKQQRLADEFVEYILRRAKEEGEDVYKKALEIVNEGKSWGFLRLEGFKGRVEVDGRLYVVKVTGWGAEIEEKQDDKKLLRLKIKAEVGRVEGEHTIVDRVVREYTITFGRYGNNAAVGFATASAKGQGGRCQEVHRRGEGPNGRGAGGVPRGERQEDKDRVLRGASKRLRALRRARRHHYEVAGGYKPLPLRYRPRRNGLRQPSPIKRRFKLRLTIAPPSKNLLSAIVLLLEIKYTEICKK